MPLDDSTDLGPLIHQKHMEGVLAHVETATAAGAQVLIGGKAMTGSVYAAGFFVPTTIVDGVTPAMDIYRQEVFGPVLTVTRFSTDAEALALSNDTDYGLASGFWTSDLSRAHMVAGGMKTGNIYINTYLETAMQLPFGGWKNSGLGREVGLAGLLEFTQSKSTYFKLSGRTLTLPHTV